MIEVDGSKKSGSGTILRLAVALAAIRGEELHIYNIRKRRKNPGLRPQHLEAVNTAAKLCNAELKGAVLDAEEIWFKPEHKTVIFLTIVCCDNENILFKLGSNNLVFF